MSPVFNTYSLIDASIVPQQLDKWLYDIEKEMDNTPENPRRIISLYQRISRVKYRFEQKLNKISKSYCRLCGERFIPPSGGSNVK